jgi:hypothetical protein
LVGTFCRTPCVQRWGQGVLRIVTCTGWTRLEGRYQRQKIIVGLVVGLAVHKTGRRGVQLCSPWRVSRRGRRVRWLMLQGGEGVEAPGGEDAAPKHHSGTRPPARSGVSSSFSVSSSRRPTLGITAGAVTPNTAQSWRLDSLRVVAPGSILSPGASLSSSSLPQHRRRRIGVFPWRRRTQGEGGARRGFMGERALGFGEHGRSGCGGGRGAPIQARQLGEGWRQERVRAGARRGLPPARLRHGEEGEQLRLTGGSRR